MFQGATEPIACHWFDEFQKNQDIFFSEIRDPGILGPLTAILAV